MKNIRNNKGITLIVLIITIIILIILSGVIVASLKGDNSIIERAKEAKEKSAKSEIIEEAKIDILEKQKNKRNSNITDEELKQILTKYGTLSTGATNIGEEILTTKENYKIPVKDIYEYEEYDATHPKPNPIQPEDPKTFIGCYADIDDNGIIDGIIFADLAIGSSGKQWNDSNGTYNIPKETGLKEYYVKKIEKDQRWDKNITKEVIAPKNGTSGKDRFYIMALEDISTEAYTWYNNAYGNMIDFTWHTSSEFGTGKNNTMNMIKKYNANEFNIQQDNGDIWKIIQGKLKGTNDNIKWFVPSRAEWSAFANELKIDNKNYLYHNLEVLYWSSSRYK